MAPVGYGILAKIAGVIMVAVIVGAIGGVINARFKGELFLGALVSALAFFLAVVALESWSSGEFALFGMLPLMLTFMVGSVTTRLLETRGGLRPPGASLMGLGSALFMGALYLLMIKLEWLSLADPGMAWIAGGVFLFFVIWSAGKWLRRRRARQ